MVVLGWHSLTVAEIYDLGCGDFVRMDGGF